LYQSRDWTSGFYWLIVGVEGQGLKAGRGGAFGGGGLPRENSAFVTVAAKKKIQRAITGGRMTDSLLIL
jgi:hypothetical protein